MDGSTFRFAVKVSQEVVLNLQAGQSRLSREGFFAFLWTNWGQAGLVGIHEGSVLSEEAATRGFETESWTIDSGEAPRERDWVGQTLDQSAHLYFEKKELAANAREQLVALGLSCDELEEQPPQDWDAIWKASFTGVRVAPHWEVLPPWVAADPQSTRKVLRVNPGAGFGTGTHETTQLCMGFLWEERERLARARVLDFGSGSGILAIAAGLWGATVDAVEIDPLAIDNSRENLSLNGPLAVNYFQYLSELSPGVQYDVIVANILKPVLLQFAPELLRFSKPDTVWILSGLMEPDCREVSDCYERLIAFHGAKVRCESVGMGEWRGLRFQAAPEEC